MKSGGLRAWVLALAAMLMGPNVSLAQVLVGPLTDFETDLPEPIPDSSTPDCCFVFFGPTADGDPNVAGDEIDPQFAIDFAHEITATGGVDGSQAYSQIVNGSGPGLEGGPGFWFTGVGAFYAFGADIAPLAGGAPGSNDPSRYRFTADVKVVGDAIDAPLIFTVTGNDGDYESFYNVDYNDDADLSDSADRFRIINQPDLQDTEDFQTVSFTLDEGTVEWQEGILPEHQGVFTNEVSLLWAINWGAAEFGLDDGNSITIDNVRIEFTELATLSGDYNENGSVDAADYTVWRDSLGQGITLPNEDPGTTPGEVTPEDYDFWKANFGSVAAASGLSVATGVPEPGTLSLVIVLLTIGAIGTSLGRPAR